MFPTVPVLPTPVRALSTMPGDEEERIDVGVEIPELYQLFLTNALPENSFFVPPQIELNLRISHQLHEYQIQLLHLHDNINHKPPDPPDNQQQQVSIENTPKRNNAHSIENILTLPTSIDNNRPGNAYLQQTSIREEQQRSTISGDTMMNVNGTFDFRSSHQSQIHNQIQNVPERGLQTDLPEPSQYYTNEFNNRLHLQLMQRSIPQPIDLVSYNVPPRPSAPVQLAPVQYIYQNPDEPLDLAMPKKYDKTEWVSTIPPAHNNHSSQQKLFSTPEQTRLPGKYNQYSTYLAK